jgi:hypothetical protein
MLAIMQTNTRQHSSVIFPQTIICNVNFGHAFAVSFVVVYIRVTASSALPPFSKPSALMTESGSNLLLRLRGHSIFKLARTEIALEVHLFAHRG